MLLEIKQTLLCQKPISVLFFPPRLDRIMPKTKKEEDDEFLPGFSRRTGAHNPSRDQRGTKKQLLKLKSKENMF